jgi:hypothetical protein
MHSTEPHPARRTGEKNYAGPGRDWGKNCHVLPGRRQGEKNHHFWQSREDQEPVFLSFDDEPSAASCFGDPEMAQGAEPSSVNQSLAATFDMMKSLSELVRVLEAIRSVSNENDIFSADERLLDQTKDTSSTGGEGNDTRPWVLAVIDQLAVLGASERIPSLNHGAKAMAYGDRIQAANDVVSRVSH